MVEFETITIISIIVGLFSYQIKQVKDKLKESVTLGDTEHKELKKEIHCIKNKLYNVEDCICEVCNNG